jgi:hypothetical protein
MLHGHQKKVLAMFVLGAIKAESIVVQRVAEELMPGLWSDFCVCFCFSRVTHEAWGWMRRDKKRR